MTQELTLVERSDFVRLDAKFKNAFKKYQSDREEFFKEGVPCLEQIRDRGLWRGNYESFEDYCEKEHGFKGKRANQFISAATTVKQLPDTVGGEIIRDKVTNERQARELGRIDKEKRADAVKEAAKDGKVTAPAIAKAAEKLARPEKVLDPTGREVHPTLMELWNRRDELNPLATQISKLKCFLEKKWEERDPLFFQLHHDAIIKLKTLHYYITSAKFEYVCGFCQGKCKILEQECPNCESTGLMTKWQWDHQVPESLKRGLKK